MKRKPLKQLQLVFPIDYDDDNKPMLPSIQAPTFATPKDAYAYFSRHLEGQPYEADLSDDDDLPSDIFDVLESEDTYYPDTSGDVPSQGPQNEEYRETSKVLDDRELTIEDKTE